MANKVDFSKDPALMASILIDPKAAAKNAGLDENNPADHEEIRRLELFAKVAQQNLKAAGGVADIQTPQLAWGIGAGCCSGQAFIARTP